MVGGTVVAPLVVVLGDQDGVVPREVGSRAVEALVVAAGDDALVNRDLVRSAEEFCGA